jgi:TIR domain
MDVLISWSGRQSRSVAEALRVWLPKVIPSLKPWISTQDIDKGSRWFNEIQKYLGNAKGCIVCLTPENVTSPWIYRETGAIALTQTNPICPLLVGDLSPIYAPV